MFAKPILPTRNESSMKPNFLADASQERAESRVRFFALRRSFIGITGSIATSLPVSGASWETQPSFLVARTVSVPSRAKPGTRVLFV